eukprot:1873716-Pleurochrysis_carterae.AAC.1
MWGSNGADGESRLTEDTGSWRRREEGARGGYVPRQRFGGRSCKIGRGASQPRRRTSDGGGYAEE